MGRILLCTGKYAGRPYHFGSVCVNVYCVEELCYLFAANPFMIDQKVMDKELIRWLGEDCGLSELSEELSNLLNKGSQPSTFVGTIMDYVNYCGQEDRKKIQEVLMGNAGLNDYERRKKRADFLLKNGRYGLAVEEYEDLCRQLPDIESALKPLIYHNMGVAYAGTFQFEMAARYFKRAYEMTGDEKTGIAFLSAKRLQLKEEAYIAFIAEHGEYYNLSLQVEKQLKEAKEEFEASEENRMLTALKIFKEEGNTVSYYEEIDKIISKQKDAYRELVSR